MLTRASSKLASFALMACAAFTFLTGVVGPDNSAEAASSRSGFSRDGIVKVKSAFGHDETIARLRKDVESKGIRHFDLVEQSKLAASAGIELRPTSLLIFGNPALGAQFITANPLAGLDWPVRVLIYTDAKGQVWVAYTDFQWIARRHRITNRAAAFKMASAVIASITSAATDRPVALKTAKAKAAARH